MTVYEALLTDEERLVREMGDEQQLKVLTLLRHSYEQYGEAVLTPRELDVLSAVYDAVVRHWNGVAGSTRGWFATSTDRWLDAMKRHVSEGEEACVRQAALWADLNHPNVLKFYGACHVYYRNELGRWHTPFVIKSYSNNFNSIAFGFNSAWQKFRDWAYGLAYIHNRGLVYQSLSRDTLLYNEKRVLSGMGLVRRQEAGEDDTSHRNGEPSAAADVLAFGLIIFERLRAFRAFNGDDFRIDELPQQLPDTRPEFLEEAEWELLTSMCAANPTLRANTEEIMYKMEMLADEEADTATARGAIPAWTTVEDLAAYVIPTASQTIEEVLQEPEMLLEDAEEVSDTHRVVHDRLVNIYEQLKAALSPLSLPLVESYVEILWRFFLALEWQTSSSYSTTLAICASRTVAGKNYSMNYAIDRLVVSASDLNSSDPVHHWHPAMQQARRHQRQVLQACLDDPSELLDQLETEAEKAEAVALLQFEARNSSCDTNTIQTGEGQQSVLAETELPQWFIPAHQVELQTHIADGAFGAVYRGKWLGTDVAVKQVLTDQMDRKNRKQFVHEANLWFKLNHANLIKLYGACHEAQPFFVSERAINGTLVANLKRKARSGVWFWLIEAARGLQHLHEMASFTPTSSKGNNIILCERDTVKLADFGLSVIANRVEESTTGRSHRRKGLVGSTDDQCVNE